MSLIQTLQSMIGYVGARLADGKPIRIPRSRYELDHLTREEAVNLFRHLANQRERVAKSSENPQDELALLKEAQSYRAMANLLDATIIDMTGRRPVKPKQDEE